MPIFDSTPKKSRCKRDSNPGSSALEADALPPGQRGEGNALGLSEIGDGAEYGEMADTRVRRCVKVGGGGLGREEEDG